MKNLNNIANSRFVQRHGIKLAWALAVICLLTMLINVGVIIHTQSQIRASNFAPQDIKITNSSNQPTYRANDIVAANLFGNPKPVAVIKKAPKTTLDLTLQGILWASDDSMARAIIMAGKKRSNLYSVGERIRGAGASVKEIRAGEVLLDRNGAVESLPLAKATTSGNRQIITFTSPTTSTDTAAINKPLPTTQQVNRSRSQLQTRRPANSPPLNRVAANNQQHNARKQKFSGLDRALKKLEEM